GAAAQEVSPARPDALGHGPELLPRFDGARPSHDGDPAAADLDAVDTHDRVARSHLAARKLERLKDRHHALDAVQRLKGLEPRLESVIADRADHGALLAAAHVSAQPERFNPSTDILDLSIPRPWLEHDDHGIPLPAAPDPAVPKKQKGPRAAGPSARGP